MYQKIIQFKNNEEEYRKRIQKSPLITVILRVSILFVAFGFLIYLSDVTGTYHDYLNKNDPNNIMIKIYHRINDNYLLTLISAFCYSFLGSLVITGVFTFGKYIYNKKSKLSLMGGVEHLVVFLFVCGVAFYYLSGLVNIILNILDCILNCFNSSITYRLNYTPLMKSMMEHKIMIVMGSVVGTIIDELLNIKLKQKGVIYFIIFDLQKYIKIIFCIIIVSLLLFCLFLH